MSDTLNTIRSGPVNYIWQDSKDNRLFSMVVNKRSRQTSVLIDKVFLDSYGSFILREEIWQCFLQYGCWIEHMLVQQWVSEMKKYRLNQQQNLSLDTYHDHLQ